MPDEENKSGSAGDGKSGARSDKSSQGNDENKKGDGGNDSGDDSDEGDDADEEEQAGDAAYRRLKADLKKERDKRKALEADARKRADDAKREEGKFRELAEERERERDEANEKLSKTEQTFRNTLRAQRVLALAEKAGLRDTARDDLDLLDLDDIEVEETDSGRYIVRGADKFVEKLKKNKPHWFQEQKKTTFNSGGGKGSGGKGGEEDAGEVTAAKLWETEKKYGRKSSQFKSAWDAYMKKRGQKK